MRVKWAWARLFTSLVTNGENVDFVFTFYYGKVQVYTKLERMVEPSITHSSPVSNNCQFMLKTSSFAPPLTLLPTHQVILQQQPNTVFLSIFQYHWNTGTLFNIPTIPLSHLIMNNQSLLSSIPFRFVVSIYFKFIFGLNRGLRKNLTLQVASMSVKSLLVYGRPVTFSSSQNLLVEETGFFCLHLCGIILHIFVISVNWQLDLESW